MVNSISNTVLLNTDFLNSVWLFCDTRNTAMKIELHYEYCNFPFQPCDYRWGLIGSADNVIVVIIDNNTHFLINKIQTHRFSVILFKLWKNKNFKNIKN